MGDAASAVLPHSESVAPLSAPDDLEGASLESSDVSSDEDSDPDASVVKDGGNAAPPEVFEDADSSSSEDSDSDASAVEDGGNAKPSNVFDDRAPSSDEDSDPSSAEGAQQASAGP